MSFRRALLAATMFTLPAIASAQPLTGIYIGAGGGYNAVQSADTNVRTSAFGNLGDARVRFEDGFVGVLSVGYGFGNGLRVEVEGNYRQNDVDRVSGSSGALARTPFNRSVGFQRTYGVMGNVFYDFDLANFGLPNSVVQPYIGGGAGYAWTEWHKVNSTVAGGPFTGARLSVNDEEGRFAYQAIAGIATPLTWLGVTGLTLTAEYRFFATEEPRLDGTIRNQANQIISRTRVEPENYNHSALLGIRYAFQQPPAPVVGPAPVPQQPGVARTYLVFFDWDRADLTGRAREIINEAAQNARRTNTTRIEVAGHADRSGTPQYNQRLSQRRADVVAAELVSRGINRNEIVVTAFGESRPLVPTADGVREPQNRRVEIVLR